MLSFAFVFFVFASVAFSVSFIVFVLVLLEGVQRRRQNIHGTPCLAFVWLDLLWLGSQKVL